MQVPSTQIGPMCSLDHLTTPETWAREVLFNREFSAGGDLRVLKQYAGTKKVSPAKPQFLAAQPSTLIEHTQSLHKACIKPSQSLPLRPIKWGQYTRDFRTFLRAFPEGDVKCIPSSYWFEGSRGGLGSAWIYKLNSQQTVQHASSPIASWCVLCLRTYKTTLKSITDGSNTPRTTSRWCSRDDSYIVMIECMKAGVHHHSSQDGGYYLLPPLMAQPSSNPWHIPSPHCQSLVMAHAAAVLNQSSCLNDREGRMNRYEFVWHIFNWHVNRLERIGPDINIQTVHNWKGTIVVWSMDWEWVEVRLMSDLNREGKGVIRVSSLFDYE